MDNLLIDLHLEAITQMHRNNQPSQLYTVLDNTGVTATTHFIPHSAPSQFSNFTPFSAFNFDTPHPFSQLFPANPTSSPSYTTHELYPPPRCLFLKHANNCHPRLVYNASSPLFRCLTLIGTSTGGLRSLKL